LGAPEDRRSQDRPNIIFVLADDQAPWALGLAGNPDARTPNMDRLGRSGAFLHNAFCVTPVCSPSRVSIISSRYGSEFGITDWINPVNEPDLGLDPSLVTWPKLLQQGGYRTGLVGKWHLGTEPRFHPKKNGFDEFTGFLAGGTTSKDPELEVEGKLRKLSGFTCDILTDYAIDFVRRNHEKPFALLVHYRDPHAPYVPQPEIDASLFHHVDLSVPNSDIPNLDTARVKRLMREYLGSVAGIDRNLGRLLGILAELGLEKNTLFIFTSDHGYNLGHHGVLHKGNAVWILTKKPPGTPNVPLGQRPNMYDTSLRVPALVRWPAAIKAGTVVPETVTHLDWFPTILAAAGIPIPSNVQVRGRNILPVLRHESVPWNNDLYAEYSMHHGARTHMRAWRTPRWKLVQDFLNPGRDELYDLRNDPGESRNLINDPRPEVRRVIGDLGAKIVERMRELKDPVLDSAKRQRRVLYNIDGDSCLFTKAGAKGPVAISIDDLKRLIEEITFERSQVDTVLVCVNAQVMYYPTKVGTMRGTLSTPLERAKWPATEKQRFENLKGFFDRGVDPYVLMLAEAKKRGREALLSFRMNDAHGNDFLRTQFWTDHPDWRLRNGALDFAHDQVRDYVFRLIEEAVRRYDCDGIELDFNRFPTFFKSGTTEARVAKMSGLVKRVRMMLDEVGRERGRRLVLGVRVPSNYGRMPPSPDSSLETGCDAVAWSRNGWVDFITVSEFLYTRYDLPIKPWKAAIREVPIYGGIECADGRSKDQYLSPEKYRGAACHLRREGADGVYLFNFFTTREHGTDAWEPPFEVLCDLGAQAMSSDKGAKDSIAVRSRKRLALGSIPCERIAIGEPDDYKPCVARLPSGELLLTGFHQYPRAGNKVFEQMLLFRSSNGGRSWSKPEKLPLLGREPYLTVSKDGTIFITGHLLASDVRNRWGYTTGFLHRSTDGGRTWQSQRIESEGIKPKASNHSSRNVLELSDGSLLLGVDYDGGDGPYFVWRSRDGGLTWDKSQPTHPQGFQSRYGFFGGETGLWQAKSGKIWALVRVDSNEFPIQGRPIKAGNDQADHFLLFSSMDEGRTFERVGNFGDYGEMYMSILRLSPRRLLLTFTVRDLAPPLGVRAIPGVETNDGFEFDFAHDRLMLDTKTGSRSQGGGFGPTVQLGDGDLVTSYSYRGEDDKTHLEVVRWRIPDE